MMGRIPPRNQLHPAPMSSLLQAGLEELPGRLLASISSQPSRILLPRLILRSTHRAQSRMRWGSSIAKPTGDLRIIASPTIYASCRILEASQEVRQLRLDTGQTTHHRTWVEDQEPGPLL